MQSPIKWTGSKRGQSKEILSYFPQNIDVYYEPFCGGANMAIALLLSNIKFNKIVCSDQNLDLINLWNVIKSNPKQLIEDYAEKWHILKNHKDRNSYYLEIREKFNKYRNPLDFFFINRNCFNGLIRYNSKNEFNSAFHFGRDGMLPIKIAKIILETHKLFSNINIEFICCDYKDIIPQVGDFIYLDPPYFNTKAIYSGGTDFSDLINYIKSLQCSFILSYDGKRNQDDYTIEIPKELYSKHVYSVAAKSGFGKLNNIDASVRESIYIS